jgi:hypothetical protein
MLLVFSGWTANSQVINFPDPVFKIKIKAWGTARDANGSYIVLDTNEDGEVQVSEALNVYEIYADGASGGNIFSSAEGIQYFSNLKKLTIKSNSQLTSLDLSALFQLEFLDTYLDINLSNLNVSGLTQLKTLNCQANALTQFAVNDLVALETLNCSSNKLVNFSISGLPNLTSIECSGLSNGTPAPRILNLSNLQALISLRCNASALNELNLSGVDNLATLDCRFNNFTTLDFSMLYNVETIQAQNNYLLEYLFVKNGRTESVDFGSNQPSTNVMKYVCADEEQLQNIRYSINLNGYTNCRSSSYCTFTPGGNSYNTITGSNRYDLNNNGCDAADNPYSNFKLNLTKADESSIYIADVSGNYNFYPQDGAYTLTPIIEHPDYFNVNPAAVTINFPQQSSPLDQNFCVSPNGIRNDLEVEAFCLTNARPGFDTKCRIIYHNKGNQVQSGTLNFDYDDTVLDFITANPVPAGQNAGNLNWNFLSLQPFETRMVELTLNLNSPLETPPVNAGFVLDYAATVASLATDETPENNIFEFENRVVNSFDPNDKTCLEGDTITPAMVGKYVHYMIRFENTGTANAENIVVKDMIDIDKFDVSSLVPLSGSHPFVTRITETNKVEFIFENIQLPFDNASNDGYLVFKIKTKPNLVLGNTFSNSASIYFDYNFPIITNNYTTTVAVLSNQDFEFSAHFVISPNPAKDVLNIQTKTGIEVYSISIYNMLGQLVQVIPGAKDVSNIDVSSLKSGSYFIKILSDQGSSSSRFIKE